MRAQISGDVLALTVRKATKWGEFCPQRPLRSMYGWLWTRLYQPWENILHLFIQAHHVLGSRENTKAIFCCKTTSPVLFLLFNYPRQLPLLCHKSTFSNVTAYRHSNQMSSHCKYDNNNNDSNIKLCLSSKSEYLWVSFIINWIYKNSCHSGWRKKHNAHF